MLPFAGEQVAKPDAIGSLTNLTVILVWRPDRQAVWRTYRYPGTPANGYFDGYFEERLKDFGFARTLIATNDSKAEEQTIDGHRCVMNKLTITGREGIGQQYLVWTASDLSGFPVRIEWTERNTTNIMLLKGVKLHTPAPSLFEPPASKAYGPVTLALDILKTIKSLKEH